MIGHQKPIYLFIYCINSYWETLKLKLDIYTNESLHWIHLLLRQVSDI